MAMLGKSMRARRDDMTLITEGPQAGTPAFRIDASHDLEISPCKGQLWLLAAAAIALTLVSATFAFGWWGGLDDNLTSMGYAGVVVFGLMTGRLIWMLPAVGKPVVIITPYGIRDLRIGNEFLLWDSIAEISAEGVGAHKTIVLTPTLALQRQLAGGCNSARAASSNRIVIHQEGLAADFDTLLRACRDCHAASKSPAPIQHEDERGIPAGAPSFAARAT